MTIFILIVQSQYNISHENTSLVFEVCNSTAGDCESVQPITISDSINTKIPQIPIEHNQNIIIAIATLAGLIAIIAIVSFGIWCCKRNCNHLNKRNKGTNTNVDKMICYV